MRGCRRRGFHPWAEDVLQKEMAIHSSILAWEIPGTEEPLATVHGVAKSRIRLSDWITTTITICSYLLCVISCETAEGRVYGCLVIWYTVWNQNSWPFSAKLLLQLPPILVNGSSILLVAQARVLESSSILLFFFFLMLNIKKNLFYIGV